MSVENNYHDQTKTHPLVTLLLAIIVLASLIGGGSYVSKQRSLQRTAEIDGPAPAATVSFLTLAR